MATAKAKARWTFCTALAAPLIVAAVVMTGFTWLSVENLNGSVRARQVIHDHAVAIRNLLIRY